MRVVRGMKTLTALGILAVLASGCTTSRLDAPPPSCDAAVAGPLLNFNEQVPVFGAHLELDEVCPAMALDAATEDFVIECALYMSSGDRTCADAARRLEECRTIEVACYAAL